MNLSVENIVHTIEMKFTDGTVGTIVRGICETSCSTTECHDEQGNGNCARISFAQKMMSIGIKNAIE